MANVSLVAGSSDSLFVVKTDGSYHYYGNNGDNTYTLYFEHGERDSETVHTDTFVQEWGNVDYQFLSKKEIFNSKYSFSWY